MVMTQKEIKTKYKMTILGFVWAFVTPALQMFILCYIFNFLVSGGVGGYFFQISSGVLMWNFLSSSILRSTTIFIDQRHLIQKTNFPKEVLVLSIIAANLIHMLISFGLLLITMIFFGKFYWGWLFLVVPIFFLLLLTIGLSLILSSTNVKHRDINLITQTAISIWFYVTPIVYKLDIIPKNQVWLFCLNPMTVVINTLRFFLAGEWLDYLGLDIISLSIIVCLFIVGILVFRKTSPYFNEWV